MKVQKFDTKLAKHSVKQRDTTTCHCIKDTVQVLELNFQALPNRYINFGLQTNCGCVKI